MSSANSDADDGQEHPQADLRRRQRRRARAGSSPARLASSQGLRRQASGATATSRRCRQITARKTRMTLMRRSRVGAGGAGGCVLRDEVLRRRRARCSRRPSDRRPAGPCPNCRAPAASRGVCHSSVVARQGLPPAGRPAGQAPDQVEQEDHLRGADDAAPRCVMNAFSVVRRVRDERRVAELVVAARHADEARDSASGRRSRRRRGT